MLRKLGCVLFVILSMLLLGCTSSDENTLVNPQFEEPEAPPLEVTIDQLWQEFQENPEIAAAKYKGQRLYFSNVLAENVKSTFLDARAGDNIWIRSGPVEFIPRYYQYIDGILPGFILDIVGDCLGLRWNRLVITDCWVQVVSGELGDVVADEY